MFNQTILLALQDSASFNKFNKYKSIEPRNEQGLRDLRNESEQLCESIEYGLFHLGDMMSRLGFLADADQDVDNVAMNNDNVKHIGGLIKANAYLLNALRETAGLADVYLDIGTKKEGDK
jgi:hypothetical protein